MKTRVETVGGKESAYTVEMGGVLDGVNTRDPAGYSPYGQAFEPNVSVRMENVGDTELVNPWIVVNGKRDWRSIEHVLDEILDDGMSDGEKARAIWEFARSHRYHYTCASDEVKDTVKMLNVYGYTLCWDEAYTVSNLWQAAGLNVRRGYPHGHCTTEVYYDGEYHLLDSDEHLLYLRRDNRTVASEEDLARDRDLVKRGHAYGILQDENPERAEGASALFFFRGHRTGGRRRVGDHRMDVTLRPGEALVWEWADRGKYHGYWDRPKRLANGRMEYVPDLSKAGAWADRAEGWTDDGENLRPASSEGAVLEASVRSPYVVVGGRVTLEGAVGEADTVEVSVSRDGKNWTEACAAGEGGRMTFNLDPAFSPDSPASYAYWIRLEVRSNGAAGFVLRRLAIETDLQMAPLSLPALEAGENEVRYTCESGGEARITHTWTEREAEPPPQPPDMPTFPGDGAAVAGTAPAFSWPAVDGAVDYHFQLGERPDMAFTLSPVFDKLTSKTPSSGAGEWTTPFEGLLSPGRTYHWRVRARNGNGLWGAWSPVWSFTLQAPGVPGDVDVAADWDARTLTLSWTPDPEGTAPDHYEVYGSDERGFTASREPYVLKTGKETSETVPANLMGTTTETRFAVAGPAVTAGNFAFYRVVAVDEDGNRSGASDLAEAPRPMIVSDPEPSVVAGETYTYRMQVTASIGELRAERVENRNYVTEVRDGDTLRFLMDEGPPEWMWIDEWTGVMTARPGPEHRGLHTVTLRVQNGQGGVDMQGFDLEVR